MKYFPKDMHAIEHYVLRYKINRSTSKDLEYRAIFNWALDTCVKEILESDYPALVVCEEFTNRMDNWAFSFNDADIRRSWFIARDAGEYLQDLFIEAIEEYKYKAEKLDKRLKKRRSKQ